MNVLNNQRPATIPDGPLAFKKPFHRRLKIPILAQVSGLLFLLLISAGLLTVRQLSLTSQDVKTLAAAETVKLTLEPATSTLEFGQEKEYKIMAETNPVDLKVSAADLVVLRIQNDLIEIVDITPTTRLPVVLRSFQADIPGVRGSIVLGATPKNEFKGKDYIATVKVRAKDKAGTARLTMINGGSQVAAFGNSNNVYDNTGSSIAITVNAPVTPPTTVCWNYVIGSGNNLNWPNACKGIPKTAELVCAEVITPLAADEKTAYSAWIAAGSPVPEICKVSPPPVPTDPKLSLKFRIQGVTKAGIVKTADVTIRYHQKNSAEMFNKTFPLTVTSQTDGTFGTTTPITLTAIHPEMIDQLNNKGVDILVKTPTTLRKKLGTIAYPPTDGSNTLVGNFNTQDMKLMVGDFDRSHTPHEQENYLRGSDIGRMVSKLTDLSIPATGEYADLDINHDGFFRGNDIGLIVGNLTDISISGDSI